MQSSPEKLFSVRSKWFREHFQAIPVNVYHTNAGGIFAHADHVPLHYTDKLEVLQIKKNIFCNEGTPYLWAYIICIHLVFSKLIRVKEEMSNGLISNSWWDIYECCCLILAECNANISEIQCQACIHYVIQTRWPKSYHDTYIFWWDLYRLQWVK